MIIINLPDASNNWNVTDMYASCHSDGFDGFFAYSSHSWNHSSRLTWKNIKRALLSVLNENIIRIFRRNANKNFKNLTLKILKTNCWNIIEIVHLAILIRISPLPQIIPHFKQSIPYTLSLGIVSRPTSVLIDSLWKKKLGNLFVETLSIISFHRFRRSLKIILMILIKHKEWLTCIARSRSFLSIAPLWLKSRKHKCINK